LIFLFQRKLAFQHTPRCVSASCSTVRSVCLFLPRKPNRWRSSESSSSAVALQYAYEVLLVEYPVEVRRLPPSFRPSVEVVALHGVAHSNANLPAAVAAAQSRYLLLALVSQLAYGLDAAVELRHHLVEETRSPLHEIVTPLLTVHLPLRCHTSRKALFLRARACLCVFVFFFIIFFTFLYFTFLACFIINN